MKINQAISAIEAFHGRAQASKTRQHALILSAMTGGRAYTGQQLSHLTGLPPNIISARLFELREERKMVERTKERRICPHSKISVFAHRRVPQQLELEAA